MDARRRWLAVAVAALLGDLVLFAAGVAPPVRVVVVLVALAAIIASVGAGRADDGTASGA